MSAKLAASMALVSRYRRDDEPVLAAMPLKPGVDPAELSRFGDDRWDLYPAIFRENLPTAHREAVRVLLSESDGEDSVLLGERDQ